MGRKRLIAGARDNHQVVSAHFSFLSSTSWNFSSNRIIIIMQRPGKWPAFCWWIRSIDDMVCRSTRRVKKPAGRHCRSDLLPTAAVCNADKLEHSSPAVVTLNGNRQDLLRLVARLLRALTGSAFAFPCHLNRLLAMMQSRTRRVLIFHQI